MAARTHTLRRAPQPDHHHRTRRVADRSRHRHPTNITQRNRHPRRIILRRRRVPAFPLLALSVAAVTIGTLGTPAEAQRRVYRGDQTERITIIDENGRARTRITVKPRSYLDGGTEVLPGERKFMDYAQPPTYLQSAPTAAWDPTGTHRFPLPMPFELPGYSPYSYW